VPMVGQKFDEELRKQQRFVDELVLSSNKILAECHPDAKREVGYQLRAISARWQQVRTGCLAGWLAVCLKHTVPAVLSTVLAVLSAVFSLTWHFVERKWWQFVAKLFFTLLFR